MKTIRETIGNASILIQMIEDYELEVVNETQEGPNIIDTGVEEEVKEAYSKAKAIIKGFAEDIGTELETVRTNARPKQMEIEFNMGLSAQAGVWILGVKNDYVLKVKMTWELGKNGQ